jgi:hypothetical protein
MDEDRMLREDRLADRADIRADRADALMDRMDSIYSKLADKLEIIAISCAKMDTRLNNHLKHHETFEKCILYPLIFVFLCGAGTLAWSVIRSHL